jgi:Ca-activated chloride channel family protein
MLEAILSVFIHAMHKGGPMMWPIVLCAVLALAFGLRDILRLLRLRTRRSVAIRLDGLLRQGAHAEALALCAARPQGSLEGVVEAGLRRAHRHPRILEGAVRQAALAAKRRLPRKGRGLPTLASVAIFCGVLGSIEGMLLSFEAVARASAETKESLVLGFDLPARPYWRLPPPSRHEEHGIGGMKLAAQHPLSTFAVDVDTASYAIVRRQLREGWLPEPAAVRVEEFVNAMPYSYAPESGPAPVSVYLEAAPDPWLPDRHLLAVGLKGRVWESARPPMNLVFLADVSGSMSSPDRLPLAQATMHTLVDGLELEDRVSLVTFAGATELLLPPTEARHSGRIHRAIDRLSSGGGTAMEDGLTTAYTLAREGHRAGGENRVIMLSDGGANIGLSEHQAILDGLGELRRHTSLTTVGFGMGEYRDDLMERLANQADGNAFYVDSPEEARKVFGAQLTANLSTIAKDVKIQLEFDPSVVLAWRLVGYENRVIADEDFRDDTVDGGEIGPGHEVTALYQLALVPHPAQAPLATVRLRARPPDGEEPAREWTTQLPLQDLAPSFAQASPDLHAAFTAASFAELLRGSPWVEDLDYAALQQLAEAHDRGLPEDEEIRSLIALADELTAQRGSAASDLR